MASTDPKIATQGQWEDLADRVQSKAEIGSVLSTPSNVAYVDTNNIVDAAVTTSKIADGAVTADKMDFSDFEIGGDYTQFLQRSTSITPTYSYVVPDEYKLAFVVIYIDANANSYRVGVNADGNIGYSSVNIRTTFSMIVTGGDTISVNRESGTASDPWHVGFIRKIF